MLFSAAFFFFFPCVEKSAPHYSSLEERYSLPGETAACFLCVRFAADTAFSFRASDPCLKYFEAKAEMLFMKMSRTPLMSSTEGVSKCFMGLG